MTFCRARTREQIGSRENEIMNACEQLFIKEGYEGVNIKAISEKTSFTRSSIYNYYRTKDEILLDLLKRDMLLWTQEFQTQIQGIDTLTKEEYSEIITTSIMHYDMMLQLFSILFTTLEKNSEMEKIVEFKQKIVVVLNGIVESVGKYFHVTQETGGTFVSSFLAYILGLYPMANLTQRQKEAIRLSGIAYVSPDFKTMCKKGICLLLSEIPEK